MNILIAWFSWFFIDRSKTYFLAYKNFLKFGINFFSTPLLIKSFFSPWKRIGIESPKKTFDIAKTFEAFFFGLFSRFFGAFFRTFFILIGLIFTTLILIGGLIFYFLWLFLPVLLLIGIFYGLKLLII